MIKTGFWKITLAILLTMFLAAGCAGTTPTSTVEIPPTVTRFPPSATPTPLILNTATTIPSFTPTSASSSVYYMIALDASARMNGPFDGKTKWDAARAALQTILDGLEPGANYGLTVIGASTAGEGVDPCNEPSVAQTPFSARSAVGNQIDRLQPAEGGSLYAAFSLARRQFEGLPRDTVKALIVITDSADECRSQDEWKGLENLYKVVDETGLEFRTEIIVLDETVNPTASAAANRIVRLSTEVNLHFPTDNALLAEVNETVVGGVTDYVESAIAARPTQTPESLRFTFTPESGLPTNTLGASSYTLTPKPGTATFTPTITLTPAPVTFTATLTPTITRTPTATRPPFVELISATPITTRIGCQMDIVVKVSGSPAAGSFHVLNASNGPNGDVYPEVILPVGTYGNNAVTLNGDQPESYIHEVWFEFNGIESNRLKGLVCPLLPKATATQ